MSTRERRFTARRTDVVVESVGSDLLIFDRHTDTAHCLAEAAALVWRSCESGATLSELAPMLVAHNLAGSIDDAAGLAEAALLQLDEKGLLDTSLQPGGMPRRQALRRIAGVGALAFSAPMIVSATAYGARTCIPSGDACPASVSCCAGTVCLSTTHKCGACISFGGACNSSSDCCPGEVCCTSGMNKNHCHSPSFC